MKTAIHPTYSHLAKVICATCGHSFVTGSTVDELRVEVCSNCHPFFTGKQQLVDTAGRVDRFQKMVAKTSEVTRPLRSRRDKLQAKKDRKVAKAEVEE